MRIADAKHGARPLHVIGHAAARFEASGVGESMVHVDAHSAIERQIPQRQGILRIPRVLIDVGAADKLR